MLNQFFIFYLSESEHRRHDGVFVKRDLQLRLHAERPLALRQRLLQGLLLHLHHLSLRKRLHAGRNLRRQAVLLLARLISIFLTLCCYFDFGYCCCKDSFTRVTLVD